MNCRTITPGATILDIVMRPSNLIKLVTLTGLLALAGCVPQSQYNQEVQQVQQLKYMDQTYRQLNQNLQSEVSSDQVEIKQLQNRLRVTMVDDILFPEGGWELNEKGRSTLSKVVPSLQDLSGKQISIEGYTDNLPIEGPLRERFPTNWELSAARSAQVVRFLQDQGINPGELAVVGMGQYHPIASNDTAQGRAKNRRIDILIQDTNPEPRA
jgi:chemotaxis protein MotB